MVEKEWDDEDVEDGDTLPSSEWNQLIGRVKSVLGGKSVGNGIVDALEGHFSDLLQRSDTDVALDGDAQPPEDHNNTAHSEEFLARDVTSISSGTYSASKEEVILAHASEGSITVTLPSPESDTMVSVKKTDDSSNTVTVETSGTETIDGKSTFVTDTQYEAFAFISDGGDWYAF